MSGADLKQMQSILMKFNCKAILTILVSSVSLLYCACYIHINLPLEPLLKETLKSVG
jgi:hypothetical protein